MHLTKSCPSSVLPVLSTAALPVLPLLTPHLAQSCTWISSATVSIRHLAQSCTGSVLDLAQSSTRLSLPWLSPFSGLVQHRAHLPWLSSAPAHSCTWLSPTPGSVLYLAQFCTGLSLFWLSSARAQSFTWLSPQLGSNGLICD
jgi:hypothetical protein